MKSSKRKASADNEADPSQAGPKQTKLEENSSGKLLNGYLMEKDFKTRVSDAFSNTKSLRDLGAIVYNEPFTCCSLPNFISDETFFNQLKEELLKLNFKEKSNDLYKFKQSDDLKNHCNKHISILRKTLYEDFRLWIEDVMGFELTDEVDMSCSKYEDTDLLLCHDDRLEGRRVAYILYLVPHWTAEDGGSLDLYSVDENGQPDNIVESLIPKGNCLVFFEVSPVSFHQVSEVLSENKTRLSISGWFHGNPVERPPPYIEPCQVTELPKPMEDEHLVEWINPIYLDEGVVSHVRERFEDESEIELQDFLLERKYDEVLEALRSEQVKWNFVGPSNKRHYERASLDNIPAVLNDLKELFKSTPMFKLLRTLTGLELADTPLTSNEKDQNDRSGSSSSNPRCRGEIRRWSHGSYTLVHDTDPERAEYALDAMLYCGCEGWDSEEWGGFTSYLANEEDEELLSVHPLTNSLALVYRDMETLKFVKHINHKCTTFAAPSDTRALPGQEKQAFEFTKSIKDPWVKNCPWAPDWLSHQGTF